MEAATERTSGPKKFTLPFAVVNGPATLDTLRPSICNAELATPFGLATFQLILPFASEITTPLIVGGATVNVPLKLVLLPAESVAVIRKLWLPSAKSGNDPEKFTAPDVPANGPDTVGANPSTCSVELVTRSVSETLQLIFPFVCDTTTWPIVGPVAAALTAAFGEAADCVDGAESELAKNAAWPAISGCNIPTLNSRRSSSGSKTIRRPRAADVSFQDPLVERRRCGDGPTTFLGHMTKSPSSVSSTASQPFARKDERRQIAGASPYHAGTTAHRVCPCESYAASNAKRMRRATLSWPKMER